MAIFIIAEIGINHNGDIEIAKEIRPESIRAKHGMNRVLSGIHCTDLECDGANECEYCFHIMTSVLV